MLSRVDEWRGDPYDGERTSTMAGPMCSWPLKQDMRQILLKTPGEFIEKQAPRPTPALGEALVRIRKVGICGSDLHAFAGRHPAYTYPRILGHELAGEVVEVPPNHTGIEVGDHCAIEPYLSCGACRACQTGRTNCCEHLRLFGVHIDGGMQGFLSVPVSLLHKSKTLSLDQLALIETLGIGAHAVSRSGVAAGEEVLVIGAGPIGLAVIQFAQNAGAQVRVLEMKEWRRKFAHDHLDVETLAEPDKRLADVVFDATGSARSMSGSLEYVAPGGRVVFVGLTKGLVTINDTLMHKREMTLFASRNSCSQFPRIIQMIAEGKIDTSLWITDRLRLTDVPTCFKGLSEKTEFVKAIVDVNDSDS
jgi:2-desacetyl-2-hydroxyethyl bacteriochlorophyllide A dehydrogenase